MTVPHPLHIVNQVGSANLSIEWDDGRRQSLPHLALRQACRCADCKSHAQRTGRPPEVPSDVHLQELSPVGQYGVQLRFSDGHDRGIYPWSFLASLK